MASSITIEGVDAAYGAVRVLEDVTLNVQSGETVVLLGTNGNGKSTLIKCIMGMVRPEAGEIVLEADGERIDLTRKSTEEIVSLGIALVPDLAYFVLFLPMVLVLVFLPQGLFGRMQI